MFKAPIMMFCTLALAAASAFADSGFQEGVHFERIASPTSAEEGRIEVVEVFGYACPFCHQFQPYLARWEESMPDYVDLRHVPADFQRAWQPFTRAYYTAQTLGILDDGHQALFAALHDEGRPIRTINDLADFWADYGTTRETFLSTAESFSVDARVRQGRNDVGRWQVRGTPSIVINGKWRVSPRRGSTFDEMIAVVDFLIANEANAMGIGADTAENDDAAPDAAEQPEAADDEPATDDSADPPPAAH